jgi:hypothetical protein
MAKSYRAPTLAALGATDVVTHGLLHGAFREPAPFPGSNLTWTTHAMLDL